MLNKDFYKGLPSFVCDGLEKLITKYSKEQWFEKAWNEYRKYALETKIDDIRLPGYIFKKYIDKVDDVMHSYCEISCERVIDFNELCHHGILGMKWGIRRWQNEDGTLTPSGERHYKKADDRWVKRNTDKIYFRAYKQSRKEMNTFVKTNLKDAKGATAVNAYNRKLAEVMRSKTTDIRTPSGKIIDWVAKRGNVGVYMAIADSGYDMSKLKNGVWSSGRIGYKKSNVDMQEK